VSTQVHLFWRTATACCELAYSSTHSARLLLWIGPRLVYEQVVTSYHEASILAAQLKTAYS
jgi:hypothetical protein